MENSQNSWHANGEMPVKNNNKKMLWLLAFWDVDSLLGNWLSDCSTNFLGEWWSRQADFLQAHCWQIGTDVIHMCTCILFFIFFEYTFILSHKGAWNFNGKWKVIVSRINIAKLAVLLRSISSYLANLNLSEQVMQTVHSCSCKVEIHDNLCYSLCQNTILWAMKLQITLPK